MSESQIADATGAAKNPGNSQTLEPKVKQPIGLFTLSSIAMWERFTVGQALRAYTLDAAYANGFDDVSGASRWASQRTSRFSTGTRLRWRRGTLGTF